jgi:hypothetical protein
MTSLSRTFRFLTALLLLSLSGYAHASFHLWRIDQIYSNADGTIQYIVLVALSSGQEFVQGHSISVSQGGTTHTYPFTKSLPGDTSTTSGGGYYGGGSTTYKSMLLATAGFANLNTVTPDYIIPNGFLFTSGGGSIVWDTGYDTFNYTSIPMDGANALFRAGNVAFNAPQNFAGVMGQISPTYQGLWWNSPANSESGWGINITQQANTLFATWFTYDTDGTGLWVVMPNLALTGQNTYSGQMFTTAGSRFDQFDGTKVVATPVGTGTFTFSDASTGTFNYTLKGVTQTKNIMREVYGTAPALCQEMGTPGSNYQDLWWNSPANSESGWGINITQQSNTIFATWFTYDTTGKGMWIVMAQGTSTTPGTYTGALYQTSGPRFDQFDAKAVVVTPVGTGTFTFSGSSAGTFNYTLKGVTQTKNIIREVFLSPTSVCN